jgi:hypothetical protein
MAGKFLHGALVEIMQTFLIPAPNVILFQFNPETITHTWTPAQTTGNDANSNPLAVRGAPGESFSFTLVMDANDMIADGSPVAEGIAMASGVYTRLAALEMLLFPQRPAGGALPGAVSSAAGAVGGLLGGRMTGGVRRKVPPSQLPTVLLVWGPGRILPVKLTSLTITETLYDSRLLNPIHAEAQVGLQVLTPEELKFLSGPLAELANVAYTYSQGLRQTLAATNVANAVESIIGMLPV